jgi:competence protein ComFC
MILKTFGKSFLDLIYPPLCLHCNACLEKECGLFCHSCLFLFEKIDPAERCPYCFSDGYIQNDKCCAECKKRPKKTKRMASVFDYEGPPATLVKHLKYGGQPYLAKGAGALMAMQFFALNWPLPDFIIPMPMSRLRKMERGYNQSELLAESLAELIDRPVCNVLKRKGGDFSQAGLDHYQRLQLKNDLFYVKDGDMLHDKVVLLVDDVMTTGSSLNCCAEALMPAFPQDIYALTFCKT